MQTVSSIIEKCSWSVSKFLIISDNVFDPLIYYSHLATLILILFFCFFLIVKARKQLVSKILITLCASLVIWLLFDLVVWATDVPENTLFFWSIINLIEPFIYALSFYFLYVFINKEDLGVTDKVLIFILLLPTLIFTSTKLNIVGYDLTNCDREAVEGPLVYYNYAIELVFVAWAMATYVYSMFWSKNKDLQNKKQISIASIGVFLLLLAFSFGNIFGSLFVDWSVGQYGLFGIPVFVGVLTYLIVKFKTFNIKLIGAQALIVSLITLIASHLFYISSITAVILDAVTLIIAVFFGYFLIRSIKKEVKSREILEVTTKELKIANQRLLEIDRQKSEFVSFATHQLRAPLTAMKGYASMILEGDFGDINKEVREGVNRMYDSTNTLASVVDDYLNISRIELGTMEYNFAPMDMLTLVSSVISELKPSIDKTGLKFNFTHKDSSYIVRADKDKLKQVITNLIDNSLKYTPSGGIDVELVKSPINGKIQLTVKDTGLGIAPDVIPNLFSKFVRAKNGNKSNIHGTGLGLYVAKEIINAHGGRIWVESEGEGKGSTFFVEMREYK